MQLWPHFLAARNKNREEGTTYSWVRENVGENILWLVHVEQHDLGERDGFLWGDVHGVLYSCDAAVSVSEQVIHMRCANRSAPLRAHTATDSTNNVETLISLAIECFTAQLLFYGVVAAHRFVQPDSGGAAGPLPTHERTASWTHTEKQLFSKNGVGVASLTRGENSRFSG